MNDTGWCKKNAYFWYKYNFYNFVLIKCTEIFKTQWIECILANNIYHYCCPNGSTQTLKLNNIPDVGRSNWLKPIKDPLCKICYLSGISKSGASLKNCINSNCGVKKKWHNKNMIFSISFHHLKANWTSACLMAYDGHQPVTLLTFDTL